MTESKDDLPVSNTVLDPEHPLLAQFQKALKDYLLIQIDRAKLDIFEIEEEVKEKNKAVQQVGEQTYELQRNVCSQQETLEHLLEAIRTTKKDNDLEENELAKNKNTLKKIEGNIFQKDKLNKELLDEIDALDSLNNCLSKSEITIESRITVSKRIAAKTMQVNETLLKDKKRQDYMINTLRTEIWKHESELDHAQMEFNVKQNEIDKLEEIIAVENTNIVALQAEYRCLMVSWNSAFRAIEHRDKVSDTINDKLTKLKEKHKVIKSEISKIKKLTKKELQQNEKLVELNKRVQLDFDNVNSQFKEESSKKQALENSMLELQQIAEETKKCLKQVLKESQPKQQEFDELLKEIQSYLTQKFNIKQEIMRIVKSNLSSTVLSKKAARDLASLELKKKEIQLVLLDVENKRSATLNEIESQKLQNESIISQYTELRTQLNHLEQEAQQLKSKKEKLEFQYRKLQKIQAAKTIELQSAIEEREHGKGSKMDLKLTEVTKWIEESHEEVKKLQLFWLREQNNILTVSKERQEQIQQVNLMKKQVLILKQKNLRISDEIEQIHQNEKKVMRSINILSFKSEVLSEHVCKTRSKKSVLDKNNTLLQSTYDVKLRESELEFLQIEESIAEIEAEKLSLSKELIETNREGLEWEKKCLAARESFKVITCEKRSDSETTQLALQIHKYKIIYSQLRRTQEKFLRDLKQCLLRREFIHYTSESKEKKDSIKLKKVQVGKIRKQFQKKMDNLKNQIKQMKNEIGTNKKNIELMEQNKLRLERNMNKILENKNARNITLLELKRQLEDAKTSRQFKFELLLLKQRKAILYEQVVKKRKPFTLYNTENELNKEYTKQKTISNKLLKIIDYISTEFPVQQPLLSRLYNSLGIITVSLYS